MTESPLLSNITHFALDNWLSLAITLLLICLHIIAFKIAMPQIEKWVNHSKLKSDSLESARGVLSIISLTTLAALLTFVWGFDISGLMTVSASLIALLGVSLFAGWSLLSNITAFLLLIVQKSFQRGNYIRVVNGDNYAEGYISEITLFHTKLITEDKEIIIYPNTQLLLNPSIINPKERYPSMGKITQPSAKKELQEKQD